MNYEFTDKCESITQRGMNDKEYDNSCRRMIIAGMEWIHKHPDAMLYLVEKECGCGKCSTVGVIVSSDTMKMQKSMLDCVGSYADGTMLRACSKHVMKAHEIGWEKYIEQLEEIKQQIWN